MKITKCKESPTKREFKENAKRSGANYLNRSIENGDRALSSTSSCSPGKTLYSPDKYGSNAKMNSQGDGASLSPLKLNRITDQGESSKETIAVQHNLHDVYKSLKRRANDIATLNGMVKSDCKPVSRERLDDDFINKLNIRENLRVQNEQKRLAALQQYVVEDKELKNETAAKLKKIVVTFEELSRRTEKIKSKTKTPFFLTIEDQVNNIMILPDPEIEKPKLVRKKPLSENKSLSTILHFIIKQNNLEIAFIASLLVKYSRYQFQSSYVQALKASRFPINYKKLADEAGDYLKKGKDKVYEILLINNQHLAEDIAAYKKSYRSRQTSGSKII